MSDTTLPLRNFPQLREFARLLDEQQTASFALEAVEDEADEREFNNLLEKLERALQRGTW